MALRPKQSRFVEEYLLDLNATQAAIRAGYSERTAAATGFENLRKPEIALAIAEARAKLSQKLDISKERVLKEYSRIAFADIRNLFTWDEQRACYIPSPDLTDDQAAAISEVQAETTSYTDKGGDTHTTIKLKLKTYDKKGALDSIAKHLGMFIDRHELSGPDGGPIQTQELSDEQLQKRAALLTNRLLARGTHTNGNGKNGKNGHG